MNPRSCDLFGRRALRASSSCISKGPLVQPLQLRRMTHPTPIITTRCCTATRTKAAPTLNTPETSTARGKESCWRESVPSGSRAQGRYRDGEKFSLARADGAIRCLDLMIWTEKIQLAVLSRWDLSGGGLGGRRSSHSAPGCIWRLSSGPDQRETTQLSYQLHQIFLVSYSAELQNIQAVELVFKARRGCSRGGTALTPWLMPRVPNTAPHPDPPSSSPESTQPKSKQRYSHAASSCPFPPSWIRRNVEVTTDTHVTCPPLPYSGNVTCDLL